MNCFSFSHSLGRLRVIKRNKKWAIRTNRIILQASVYILLLGLYQSTLRQSIEIFDCEDVEDGNGNMISVLAMDNGPCPQGTSDEYLQVIGATGCKWCPYLES